MIRILKLKNWVFFLLLYFGPGFIVAPASFLVDQLVGEDSVHDLTIWITLLIFIRSTWDFSIGNGLSKLIPTDQKFNRPLYNIIFVTRCFIVIYAIVMITTFAELDMALVLALIPLCFSLTLCSLYIFFQNGKIIRAGELNRPVYFNDFYHYFFLQIFFSIGIWLIQLRINRLIKAKEETINGAPITVR